MATRLIALHRDGSFQPVTGVRSGSAVVPLDSGISRPARTRSGPQARASRRGGRDQVVGGMEMATDHRSLAGRRTEAPTQRADPGGI